MKALEKFITEIGKAWGPLTSETVAECDRLLAGLARETEDWLGAGSDRELYRDSERGFVLTAYAEESGRYRVPHDHGAGWVVYAVQSGEMRMSTFARTVTQSGELRLVRRESYLLRGGDSRVYLPGDIHDTLCTSARAVLLRLTSCDLKAEDREGRMVRYGRSAACPPGRGLA